MKLTDRIIWNGLEDNCIMIVDEIDLEGLKFGQIHLKGASFQIDVDTNTVQEIGYRTVVLDTTVNIFFDENED